MFKLGNALTYID